MTLAELKQKVDAALASGTHPMTDVRVGYETCESFSIGSGVEDARPYAQGGLRFLIVTEEPWYHGE